MNILKTLTPEYLEPVEHQLQEAFQELRDKFVATDIMVDFTTQEESVEPKLRISIVNGAEVSSLTGEEWLRLDELFPHGEGEDPLSSCPDQIVNVTLDVMFSLALTSNVEVEEEAPVEHEVGVAGQTFLPLQDTSTPELAEGPSQDTQADGADAQEGKLDAPMESAQEADGIGVTSDETTSSANALENEPVGEPVPDVAEAESLDTDPTLEDSESAAVA